MHVISRTGLLNLAKPHPKAGTWVEIWLSNAEEARWTQLGDVRQTYPSADQVGECLIFDCGNSFRLIATVVWAGRSRGTLFIKYFLTHAEYDRDAWKECCNL